MDAIMRWSLRCFLANDEPLCYLVTDAASCSMGSSKASVCLVSLRSCHIINPINDVKAIGGSSNLGRIGISAS